MFHKEHHGAEFGRILPHEASIVDKRENVPFIAGIEEDRPIRFPMIRRDDISLLEHIVVGIALVIDLGQMAF